MGTFGRAPKEEDKEKGGVISPDVKDVIKALSNPIGLNLFKSIATITYSNKGVKIKADFRITNQSYT